VNKIARVGVGLLVVMLLVGLWLFFSPFMFAYQPQGQHWVNATRNDLWTGGLLTLAAVAGLLGIAVAAVRDLIRNTDHS
jgi:hypothetical protein